MERNGKIRGEVRREAKRKQGVRKCWKRLGNRNKGKRNKGMGTTRQEIKGMLGYVDK